jgi:uncharacterized coiled-coil protein SlyX
MSMDNDKAFQSDLADGIMTRDERIAALEADRDRQGDTIGKMGLQLAERNDRVRDLKAEVRDLRTAFDLAMQACRMAHDFIETDPHPMRPGMSEYLIARAATDANATVQEWRKGREEAQ